MSFVHKSVNPTDQLGADLVELRKRAGFTRDQAAGVSKLTVGFIALLEEDRLQELSDPVYAERQLKAYVRLLGGNPSYFLHKYRTSLGGQELHHEVKDLLPRSRHIRPQDLVVGPRWIALAAFVGFLVFLGGYVYWQARGISSAPPLLIHEPADGVSVDEPFVRVRGETMPEATVVINGRTVPVDEKGIFESTINIPRGSTILVITAKRRYGNQKELTRRIIYDRPLPEVDDVVSTYTNEKTLP
jgi:hypothetical protein